MSMTVKLFQVRKKVQVSVTRVEITFDMDGASVFGGFVPMLVRVVGGYASDIEKVKFTAHG